MQTMVVRAEAPAAPPPAPSGDGARPGAPPTTGADTLAPLSRSATADDRLEPPDAGGGFDRAYWRRLERLAGAPPRSAERLRILRDPRPAWEARLALVRSARSSIVGTLYHVYPDRRGLRFVDELLAARRRGVEVVVGLDLVARRAIDRQYPAAARRALDGRLDELRRAGGFVAWAGTLDDQVRVPGAGVHFKSLVADGRTAVTGGRNVGDPYFGPWSDFDVAFEGPLAAAVAREALELLATCEVQARRGEDAGELRARFRAALGRLAAGVETAARHAEGRPPSVHRAVLQLVSWDPLEDGRKGGERRPNHVTLALEETFRRARHEILATSNYVAASEPLRQALVDAARRGVAVKLVTSGPGVSGAPGLAHAAVEATYADLVAAGCRIHETRAMEHGKMYVVDRATGAFGSYNLSRWADERNAEGLYFTADRRVVSALADAIESDIATKCRRWLPPPELPWYRRAWRAVLRRVMLGARAAPRPSPLSRSPPSARSAGARPR